MTEVPSGAAGIAILTVGGYQADGGVILHRTSRHVE